MIGTMKYRIIDLSGKSILSGTIDNTPFFLPRISKGIYLLHLMTSEKEQLLPFIN
jgi:hypothetical protein